MNCKDYQKMISRWLDGELNEEEISSLKSHLEQCSRCRQMHSDLSAVHEIHLNLPDRPVPDYLSAGLSFEPGIRRHSGRFKILRNTAVAAAVAGAIIAGAGIGGGLAERGWLSNESDGEDLLNLEYLYATPPGSTGEVLMDVVREGSENEEE